MIPDTFCTQDLLQPIHTPRIACQEFQGREPRHHQHLHDSAALSGWEFEVLTLLVEGHSNPEIAQILHISPSAVKAHHS